MTEPWTLPPPGSLTWPIIAEVFQAHGLDVPRAALVTSSIPARNALLATGRFLSLVPASVLRLGGRGSRIRALPIDIPTRGRPIGILTLKNRTLSPVAQRFIAVAREVAKSIGGTASARQVGNASFG